MTPGQQLAFRCIGIGITSIPAFGLIFDRMRGRNTNQENHQP